MQKKSLNKVKSLQTLHEKTMSVSSNPMKPKDRNNSRDQLINIAESISQNIKKDYLKYLRNNSKVNQSLTQKIMSDKFKISTSTKSLLSGGISTNSPLGLKNIASSPYFKKSGYKGLRINKTKQSKPVKTKTQHLNTSKSSQQLTSLSSKPLSSMMYTNSSNMLQNLLLNSPLKKSYNGSKASSNSRNRVKKNYKVVKGLNYRQHKSKSDFDDILMKATPIATGDLISDSDKSSLIRSRNTGKCAIHLYL